MTLEEEGDTPELHLHPGGQGYWVARMIRELGLPVTLCAPLGGEIGVVLRTLLRRAHLDLRTVRTRSANGSYLHRRTSAGVVDVGETPSPRLSRHEADDLYEKTLASALDSSLAVLTGANSDDLLDPSFMGRLASDLRKNGRRVLADLSGAQLSSALEGGIDLLHVNVRELAEHDASLDGDRNTADIVSAMQRLQAEGARRIVASRGADPAIVLLGSRVYELRGPVFDERESRGAGDSMFAAIAAGLARGVTVEEALRMGAAAGAVNVIRRGLGSGHSEDLATVAARVVMEPLDV